MELKLKNIQKEALAAISAVDNKDALKAVEVEYLGRKGKLTAILKGIKDLTVEEKKIIGQLSNVVKVSIQDAILHRYDAIIAEDIRQQLEGEFFDATIPGNVRKVGSINPLSQMQKEIEDIFSQMGFDIKDGPEVESEYFNFEALNIPAHHPARDMQDTFFIDNKNDKDHGRMVLRTHTSPVQIRTMQKEGAPLRIIVPGRVFRYESVDASHDSTFNQVEGLLIDKDISLAHLKGVMSEFLMRLFKKNVEVRFRPGYFPFVEPGFEIDFKCLLCKGNGCSVCNQTGWVEIMGAGMVHENVLKAGGIDSSVYQGWAFGFGLTRLLMMRYEIDDIRLLMNGDLRFIKQF